MPARLRSRPASLDRGSCLARFRACSVSSPLSCAMSRFVSLCTRCVVRCVVRALSRALALPSRLRLFACVLFSISSASCHLSVLPPSFPLRSPPLNPRSRSRARLPAASPRLRSFVCVPCSMCSSRSIARAISLLRFPRRPPCVRSFRAAAVASRVPDPSPSPRLTRVSALCAHLASFAVLIVLPPRPPPRARPARLIPPVPPTRLDSPSLLLVLFFALSDAL